MSSFLGPEFVEQQLHRDVEAQPVPVNFIVSPPEGYSDIVRAQIADADKSRLLENMIDDSFKRGLIAEIMAARAALEQQRIESRTEIIAANEALAKERIESRTDELTGVGNRKKLIETFNEIVGLGHELDIIFIDFDDFGAINGLYTHPGGDAALQSVAENLSGLLREGEELFRYGGDEFIVVRDLTKSREDRRNSVEKGSEIEKRKLPRRKNTPDNPEEIEGLANRIARAFMESDKSFKELHPVNTDDTRQIISGTTGHATYKKGDTIESLIKRASSEMKSKKPENKVA